MSCLTRRGFAATLASSALASAASDSRPNILWITCEDIGPALGCYGDKYADTPNLDKLAARGMMYRHAWSNAPVCAPARTTIISGLYPPCTGSEHMRSMTHLPEPMKMYPCHLREAGYYTTNNSKEDYNLEHTGQVWDESSGKAHWRKRKPGQPFMSVFNLLITHESQIRTRPHTWVHDPAKARIPAYHPDAPEVRQDWAQYYDNITTMDGQAGQILKQLEDDGLADSTIVFFYGDHGSGMPRSKRWPYNSGLQVPLIVFIPEKFRRLAPKEYKPGGSSERMAAFVDLAPTVLSLAGIKPPAYMQGSALAGEHPGPERPYNFGFRGRMDERYDLVRSVRDKRYVYIRNYMPHKVYGQYIDYMFETPTTRVWKKLYDEGKLQPPKTYFWETKPPEELYDLQSDPDEVNNLAKSPEHRQILKRLRGAQQEWARSIRDVGFLPEGEIHARSKGSSPYEMGHDEQRYPLPKIMGAAEMASGLDPAATGELAKRLADSDSAVRYWAAMGLLMRGTNGVSAAGENLRKALADSSPYVRAVAAEALGRYGGAEDLKKSLDVLMQLAPADTNGAYVALFALNALDSLGRKAMPVKDALKPLPLEDTAAPVRAREYGKTLVRKMSQDLAAFASPYSVSARTLADPALGLIVLHDADGGIEASICPSQGGELCSLRLRHGGKWVELLYRAADYRPTEGWRGKAPLLWPATGRSLSTRGAGYVWKDRLYAMPDHGFVRDMPWDVVKQGSDAAGAFVTLGLADNADTRRQFPFGFRLTADYRLGSGAAEIRYTVAAARDNSDPMFFSIGNHITFRTPFLEGTQPATVRIFTPATSEIVKSPERLPTGETRAWKLDGPAPLSRLKPKEALSLTGYTGAGPYVTLEDPGGLGIRMSHSATAVPPQPVVLFNLWGDAADGYFSPEPWVGLQNSFNLKQGLLHLPPGGEFGWRIRIERMRG